LALDKSGEAQACLRHRESLLELGLLGGGERARELFLRPPPRLLSPLQRDLLHVLGDVGKHGHAIGQNLEESAPDEQQLLVGTHRDLQRARFQDRHQRRVARQDAELALGAPSDDEVDVALEQAALDADHSKWNLQGYVSDLFFMSSPCARASSMVPTM
jgi:hypothetical protein